jgi:hypothetical protein
VGHASKYHFSTREAWITSAELRAHGAEASLQPESLISTDVLGRGDGYLLNRGHASLWSLHTRKVKDPQWRGPAGAALQFRIAASGDDVLVVKVTLNDWGAFGPGKKSEFAALVPVKPKEGWAEVKVGLGDFVGINGTTGPLKDWSTVTELSFTPVIPAELKSQGQSTGQGWTKGAQGDVRDLEWVKATPAK